MASRKKQDENNLKTLRELVALPQNKFCFDCGQRGPTYVNVTIGSFVCTKCSGMLRGITPPHRVKSISMATFTPEEIDTIRGRGNEYCRRVWLGLYEGSAPTHMGDEQHIRDFMVEKYERKRYYLEKAMTEVSNTRSSSSSTKSSNLTSASTKVHLNGFSRSVNNNLKSSDRENAANGKNSYDFIVPPVNSTNRSRPEVKSVNNNNSNGTSSNFAVDFDKADIFSNTPSNGAVPSSQQNGFANFDDNPVFSSPTAKGMPAPSTLNAWTVQQPQHSAPHQINGSLGAVPVPCSAHLPVEDKYAALKDLDNEMKSQHQHQMLQQNVAPSLTGSTGSLYSSPTPTTGSVYGSPSSQGSIFGSPSQGQFSSAFPPLHENGTNHQMSNPFGGNGSAGVNWGSNSGGFLTQQPLVNPFRDQPKSNGFQNGLQPVFPPNALSNGWNANPFKVGTANGNSNNPFL
ncbi:arf-GAP domain and FG repeat-containing protein 1 isoform X2 [Cylas formicarius]|uniref:arf-GAP domain and FG repeat-containing protein 1 isoform X2 n=1 Tax=Cylas formicarius TaxID=197179 RepID=UPI0029588D23|nr:arf-GAP domain and FG repeat-containing protein 1 isoform X2 [Cylas formicarius]